jgi:hypothetical protein
MNILKGTGFGGYGCRPVTSGGLKGEEEEEVTNCESHTDLKNLYWYCTS